MTANTKDIPQYVPLHLHTEYSLLDGASKIKDLITKAKQNNIPAAAAISIGKPSKKAMPVSISPQVVSWAKICAFGIT